MKNPLFVVFNLITAMIVKLAKCTELAAFLHGRSEEGCELSGHNSLASNGTTPEIVCRGRKEEKCKQEDNVPVFQMKLRTQKLVHYKKFF
ncbi:hypothetical protein M514_03179 [Trichuris suis]|uniref:Secreted protein n=1 Tax=Trichuris suis TaxID=68888 RepID=A0A085N954_9BILA|nr:hypothetical protein M514_03179 [Trichuris suis]